MRSGAWNSSARSRAARSDSFAVRVRRVRGDGRDDARVPLPLREERARHRDRLGEVLVVGHGEVEPRLAEDGAQARTGRRPRRRRTRSSTCPRTSSCRPRTISSAREERPGLHEARRDVLRLGREDELREPVHERQVVRDAAQEVHRGVRVRVDEPGQDDGTRTGDSSASENRETRARSGVPTATIAPSLIATAPGEKTRSVPSIVRTCAAVTRVSTGERDEDDFLEGA